MDLKEAQLIRRVLDLLTGSKGKRVAQLANESGISVRRASFLLMCMEKAGLVKIERGEMVVLSEHMAARAWNHVARLNNAPSKLPSVPDGAWGSLFKAVRLYEHSRRSNGKCVMGSVMGGVFNEFFGGVRS